MSKYSVRKPITVLMGILMVIVLGVYSLTKLSLSLFPDMNLPYVVVVTPYVGADAEKVVDEVTSVVESQVTSMSNFANVSSTSREHYSIVIVEYNEGTNMDSVMIDLRSKIDNITFPNGVSKPTILQVSPDMLPVMRVSLSAEYPELDDTQEFIKTTQFINEDLMDRFNAIPGVAEVSLTGAADIILEVNLDSAKINEYKTSNNEILKIIDEQNHNELVGVALDNGNICMLYLGNAVNSINELKKLPIPLKVNGENKVYKLEELCVEDGIKFINQNAESYSKVNGKQTVSISFQMQNGETITDVTKNITKTLDQIKQEYQNVDYAIIFDQGEYINLAVGSVIENLIYGAILAIAILFLFLRDIKPTLIVGLAIPISVIATFMCMYFMGINLNMLSMGGLALGIGMLVDNAIVVIENIFRLRKEGKSKKEAAIEGAKGVASAIIASTVTTIIVFVPILFLGGTVKDVFASMAYTISFSLICSLIIALTMVPAMSSRMFSDPNHCPKCEGDVTSDMTTCPHCGKKLKKQKAPKEPKPSKMIKWYEKVLNFSLNHKIIVLTSVVLLFFLCLGLTLSKGFVLLPTTDEGSISVSVNVNQDLTFENVSRYTDKLVENISEINSEIETVSASFGTSTGMMSLISTGSQSSGTSITLNVKLKEKHKMSTKKCAEEITNVIEKFDFDEITSTKITKADILSYSVEADNNTIVSLTSTGVNINVKGYNLENMEIVANKIADIVKNVEGTTKVKNGVDGSSSNLKIFVNKEVAAQKGLTEKDFIDSVNLIYSSLTFLNQLSTSENLKLDFNGVEYELSIPTDTGMSSLDLNSVLKMFGSYKEFTSNFMVFNKEILNQIAIFTEKYQGDQTKNIYIPDISSTGKIKIVLNPSIYVNNNTNEIIAINPNNSEDLINISNGTYVPLVDKSLGSASVDENDTTSIAVLKPITGYNSISSDGKYRYFSVTSKAKDGYNITKLTSKIQEEVNKYLKSEEFDLYRDSVIVEFEGENEQIMDTVEQMIIALAIGVLLVYMVIAIQFQSLINPLIIMGTLPLAFTGGLLFILIFNIDFSVVAIMGLIVLVGVAVNNGIVLIDYVNQLREQGYSVKDACIEAGKTRIRPILMTALTTIFGLLFMALGLTNGSELIQPLAVIAIGGLLYATILTLVIIPVIYYAIHQKKDKKINEDNPEKVINNDNN